MTQFTVDYLTWYHFGKHIDECNPDIVQQYRSFFYTHPNPWNLALFFETFLRHFILFLFALVKDRFSTFSRNEITLRDPKSTTDFLLNVPVLQIVGANSAFISDSVHVNSQLNPKCTEWLKVSNHFYHSTNICIVSFIIFRSPRALVSYWMINRSK